MRGDDNERMALRTITTQLLTNHPMLQLNSKYQVVQHLKNFCGLVSPLGVAIGDEFTEKTNPGKEDVIKTDVEAMFVPFRDSLVQLYRNQEIRQFLNAPVEISNDKYKCVRDGKVWKNDEFFKLHPAALIIEFYYDDVELVNALGSRTGVHKVTNFYWTLLNLPECVRSNLKAIGLISCASAAAIKKFGLSNILKDFFECMNLMQTEEGLELEISATETIFVHGKLFCMCGDGLASQ